MEMWIYWQLDIGVWLFCNALVNFLLNVKNIKNVFAFIINYLATIIDCVDFWIGYFQSHTIYNSKSISMNLTFIY